MGIGNIAGGMAAGLGTTAIYGGVVAAASVVSGAIGYVVRENGQDNSRTWEDRLGNAFLKDATRGVEGTVIGGVAGAVLGALAGPEGGVAGAYIGATLGVLGGSTWGIIEGVGHTNQHDIGLFGH